MNIFNSFKNFLNRQTGDYKVLLIRRVVKSIFRRFEQYNSLYIRALGADPVELGYINSIGSAVSGLSSLPIGQLMDKYSLKKMMLLVMVLELFVPLLFGLASDLWMIIPAMVLMQMSTYVGLSATIENVIVANSLGDEERATGFSLLSWISTVTGLVSPFLAAYIVMTFGGISVEGIRPLFFIQLLGLTPLVAVVYKRLKDVPGEVVSIKKFKGSFNTFAEDFKDILRESRAAKKYLIMELFGSLRRGIQSPFMMIFGVEIKGATPFLIGWLGIAYSLVSMVFSLPVGRLADKIGRKKTLLLTRPIMYAAPITMILAPKPEWLIIAWAEMGFPFEYMVWTTWGMEMVSIGKRGRWSSLLNLTRNLVYIPAPILGGLLYRYNPALVFILPILIDLLLRVPILATISERRPQSTDGNVEG
jgi:MFS family permease